MKNSKAIKALKKYVDGSSIQLTCNVASSVDTQINRYFSKVVEDGSELYLVFQKEAPEKGILNTKSLVKDLEQYSKNAEIYACIDDGESGYVIDAISEDDYCIYMEFEIGGTMSEVGEALGMTKEEVIDAAEEDQEEHYEVMLTPSEIAFLDDNEDEIRSQGRPTVRR